MGKNQSSNNLSIIDISKNLRSGIINNPSPIQLMYHEQFSNHAATALVLGCKSYSDAFLCAIRIDLEYKNVEPPDTSVYPNIYLLSILSGVTTEFMTNQPPSEMSCVQERIRIFDVSFGKQTYENDKLNDIIEGWLYRESELDKMSVDERYEHELERVEAIALLLNEYETNVIRSDKKCDDGMTIESYYIDMESFRKGWKKYWMSHKFRYYLSDRIMTI